MYYSLNCHCWMCRLIFYRLYKVKVRSNFLTQRATDAGHTIEEGLAGPLDVESHPVP